MGFWNRLRGRQEEVLAVERRKSERISGNAAGLFVEVDEKTFPIADISAGGMAFEGADLGPGDRKQVVVWSSYPEMGFELEVRIEVLARVSGRMLHCQFQGLSDTGEMALREFVLSARREGIRKFA